MLASAPAGSTSSAPPCTTPRRSAGGRPAVR